MATSGVIQSSSCASNLSAYGMRWEFRWTADPSEEPGVTIVSWELWTVGRTESQPRAYTQIKMTAEDQNRNNVLTYESTGELRSFNSVLQDSGNFKVVHNTDGTASFLVSMSTDIYEGVFRDTTGSWELETNLPYCVYIDTGAAIVKAIPLIDNGQEWARVIPYIDNGSTWNMCG